jgi:hypothetical protein
VTPDEQESLSRKYGNEVVLILPLSSGNIAVFNNARELCGIVENIKDVLDNWYPPSVTLRVTEILKKTPLSPHGIETLMKAGLL